MNKSIHALVEGRVQGVFFRAETQKQAKKLGLTGWVRNLDDGRVELMASGPEPALSRLSDWLRQGPPQAQVLHLEIECCDYQSFEDFCIRSG